MAKSGAFDVVQVRPGEWEVRAAGAKWGAQTFASKAEAVAWAKSVQNASAALSATATKPARVTAVLKDLEALSGEDLLRVARKAESLAKSKQDKPREKMKSLFGAIQTDLKPPSVAEIRKLRKDMWKKFPRESPG